MKNSITLSTGLKVISVLSEAGIKEMIADNEKKELAIFILDDSEFDCENDESQVWHVFISEDFMLGEDDDYKSYSRKLFNIDSAYRYAESLAKKFPDIEFVGQV